MSLNYQTPSTIAINALTNRGFVGTDNDDLELIALVTDIVDGVLEGERRDLRSLSELLQALIINIPHTCHTDEHCCSLHQAHKRAADEVAQAVQAVVDLIGSED